MKGSLVRLVLTLSAAFWLSVSPAHAAVEYRLAEAIDDAGRQRMLTQRILKTYAQVGLNVQGQQAQRELIDAVAQFDSQYQRLQQWQHEPLIAEQLQRIGRLWQVYKPQALGKVSAAEAQKLLSVSESLLSESDRLVVQLQQLSGSEGAALINLSGRQRMLSQRLAKYYLLASWGIEAPAMSEQMDRVRHEFEAALGVLKAHRFDTLKIAQRLTQIESSWSWVNSAMQQRGRDRYDLVVVDASEQLLRQLEQLTQLYVESGQQ